MESQRGLSLEFITGGDLDLTQVEKLGDGLCGEVHKVFQYFYQLTHS